MNQLFRATAPLRAASAAAPPPQPSEEEQERRRLEHVEREKMKAAQDWRWSVVGPPKAAF